MQKKQSRNLKKNIGKTQRIFENKNRKKGHSGEENYQKGLWQENYLDSQIKDMMRNTRQGQKEIGGDKKKEEQRNEE